MRVLVTGFGPFPGVPDNPTAALARAVDGVRLGEFEVVGHVLPVSFADGPSEAVRRARELGAALVVGLGVAVRRTRVCVERRAVRVEVDRPDVEGATRTGLSGPEVVRATLDCERLAEALGASLSDDAGRYVCNAWLYQVASELDVPVGFVHVPLEGLSAERLLEGLRALLSDLESPPRR